MCSTRPRTRPWGTYRTQEERDTVKVIDVGGIRLAVLAYIRHERSAEGRESVLRQCFTTDYMTNCGVIDYELLKNDFASRPSDRRGRHRGLYALGTGIRDLLRPAARAGRFSVRERRNACASVAMSMPQPMELRELPDGRTRLSVLLSRAIGSPTSTTATPFTAAGQPSS